MFSFIKRNYTQSLASASIIISLTSLISRIIGLFRDRLLAGTFDAGDTLDMYYASFRIPDLIFNLLILGALHSAFIPVFKQLLSKNQNQDAYQTANILINVIIIFTLLASIIVLIFAKPITEIIAPGFTPEKINTTANLTRIMMLSPLFFGLSAIVGGILNSFKRFFSYSLAPIFYNLGIIAGIVFLVPHYGIYGLAYGVIIGAALNLLVQIPEIILTGYRYFPQLDINNPEFKKIFFLMIPTTLSLAITQINLTVDNIIGSTLTSGSIAVFNLATNIQSLPIGIFSISICTAVFPTLVEHVNHGQFKQFFDQINRSAKQILFVLIPTAIFLYIFRAQTVRIIYGTGAFSWQATTETLTTLGFFAIGLPFQALLPLFTRSFYATQNTSKPLISGLVAMFVNIILSLVLSPIMGVAGLSLSFSIATIANLIVLNLLFYREFPQYRLDLNSTIIKIIVSSVLAGLAAYLSLYLFENTFNNTTLIGLFLQTASSSIIGIGSYFLLAYLLKINELHTLFKIFKIKIGSS
ncbi:MAG: murein biosynthesis integral membrane protein MurJ [Patescibacteria group bacterium]